jgi:[ribosomal protein S5]-alanine N-acetyltransferase
MLELQRLTGDHLEPVRAFELENRGYFARSLTDRGDDYYDTFAERHRVLLEEQEAGVCVFFVLVDRDGSVVGRFNLYDVANGTARVGYRLAERVTGRGVATDALRDLCRQAADDHGLRTLTAEANTTNLASQRVLEKAGFTPNGTCVVAGEPGVRFTLALDDARPEDAPSDPQVARYIERMRAWRAEFEALRPVLLSAGLDEQFKWRKPCYTLGRANVVIFQPFKELCALLFFKGALLEDPEGALREQGENTRSALRLEFRSVAEVIAAKPTIAALAKDAIRVEEAGLSVPKRDPDDDGPYSEELITLLETDPFLLDAWERLTPGRRRGWLLHFNAAKQSKTRVARIERATPLILEGIGMHD